MIVEATAAGTEVECGVLGVLAGERDDGEVAHVSEPGEIVFSGEFYDFGAKYSPGGMELRVPARISPQAREQVRQLAVGAFLAAGCDGLARVDFFVDGERVLVNELNTMPGFTPTSVYAKLLAASGVPLPAPARPPLPAGARAPRGAPRVQLIDYLNSVSSLSVADSIPGGSVVSHTR